MTSCLATLQFLQRPQIPRRFILGFTLICISELFIDVLIIILTFIQWFYYGFRLCRQPDEDHVDKTCVILTTVYFPLLIINYLWASFRCYLVWKAPQRISIPSQDDLPRPERRLIQSLEPPRMVMVGS